ncbi:MAG: threonylcarbamoyl-AMP synthase [Lactobacillaceae bacterium]|jgi:L-threonylcarbamoyladenylate synthase|nr:threonylcarbamoyl-AMP synthase [Lactobacillaceae bacterium]
MSNIYIANEENIAKAAELIKNGGVVAMPTETVYGLGANVYNSKAVANIFSIKGRPIFNPLISHIADIDFLSAYAQTDGRVLALAKRFWPGPLTFVLNRTESNPALDLVCAGLRTITVRMPNHPAALELIKKADVPIAAPSANLSTTISPTTAEHVRESLGDRVEMILDGGPCIVGLESTIVDLTGKDTVILRAGYISRETLENFLGEKVLVSNGDPDKPMAPGQMLKHYSPSRSLRINAAAPAIGEFFIGFGDTPNANIDLSPSGDLIEAASNLFAYLHLADKQTNFSKIAIAPIPSKGIGLAINDRITRAANK